MSFRSTCERALISAITGLTNACSVAMSIFRKTRNANLSIATFAASAAVGFFRYYYFQGKEIEKAFEPPAEAYKSLQNTSIEIENSVNQETKKTAGPSERNCGRSSASLLAQLFCTAYDAAQNFADRYFFLESLFILFGLNSAAVFWTYLAVGYGVNLVFNSGHDTYETAEGIAQAIGYPEDKPFFWGIFRCWTPRIVKYVRVVGAGEHTLTEDFLPVLLWFPVSYWVFAGSPLFIILNWVTYRQTEFFEGDHAEENIKQCSDYKNEFKEQQHELSMNEIKILEVGLKTMAAYHAAGSTAAIYVTAFELLGKLDPTTWIITTVACTLTFAGAYRGCQLSEARVSQEKLKKLKLALEAKSSSTAPKASTSTEQTQEPVVLPWKLAIMR